MCVLLWALNGRPTMYLASILNLYDDSVFYCCVCCKNDMAYLCFRIACIVISVKVNILQVHSTEPVRQWWPSYRITLFPLNLKGLKSSITRRKTRKRKPALKSDVLDPWKHRCSMSAQSITLTWMVINTSN